MRVHSGAVSDPRTSSAPDTTALPADPSLETALADLVADGTLSQQQADRVAARLRSTVLARPGSVPAQHHGGPPAPARRGRLAEIAGYLGAALLLGAAALFLTGSWDSLGQTARVVILGGLSAVLLCAGALVAATSGQPVRQLGNDRDSARRRLVSVLWTFASASAAGAAGLGVDGWEVVAASAVGLLVGAVAYALVASAVGQLGMWLASIALVTSLVSEIGDDPAMPAYAVALVALGVAWVALGLTRVVREREVALTTGATIALIGAQLPVLSGDHPGAAYALTSLVAVAGFTGYLRTRSWAVLGAGVLATTLVVPEALSDWTGGSLSAAGSLLIAGLTLLGASAAGLRLRREVAEEPPPPGR